MSFYGIVRVMLRQWYVVIAVLAVAAVVGNRWVIDGGCFTTSTVVTFTLPSRATLLPDSGAEDESLIAFAGVIANEINQGRPAPRYASREAPLYGVGVRDGVIVGLPDSGGQWSNSFTRAELEIQIVGRSYEEVHDRQTVLVRRVFEITRDQQRTAPAKQRIQASLVPLTSGIQEVSVTRSSRLVALVALGMSALLVGGWLAVHLDRWIFRAPRRRMATTSHNQNDTTMMDSR